MRKLKLFLITACFAATSELAFSGNDTQEFNRNWEWVYSKPQGNAYRGLTMLSSSDWYLSGFGGHFAKTTDAGSNWFLRTVDPNIQGNTQFDLYGIWFMDSFTGLVCGNRNTISRTTDGGGVWTLSNTGSSATTFYSFHFLNSLTGYASGSSGTILKTLDGGNNWTPLLTGGSLQINKVYAVNENLIYAAGSGGRIWKTTDGGLNWNIIPTGTTNLLNDVSFINDNTGFVCGISSTIRRTTNGGSNWDHIAGGTPFANWNRLKIASDSGSNVIYVSGFANFILKSTDMGNNWTQIIINAPDQTTASDLGIIDKTGDDIVIAGGSGIINHSSNNGGIWRAVGNKLYNGTFHDLHISGNSIIAAGTVPPLREYDPILISNDNGQNWISSGNNIQSSMKSIAMVNQNEGYIAGDSGKVFKTNDGGYTWTIKHTGVPNNLNKIKFNNSNIFVVGNGGHIFKSSNGGDNWVTLNSGTTNNLTTMDTFSDLTIIAGGSSNTLIKTVDGTTWDQLPSPFNTVLHLKFLDEQTIIASGSNGSTGALSKSTDGGYNWTVINTPPSTGMIRSFIADDVFNITIAGNGAGYTASTTDGGGVWVQTFTGSSQIFGMSKDDNGGIWIAGSSGNIMKKSQSNFTLNTRFFLQGFYDPDQNIQIADDVTVEIRSNTVPFNIIDQNVSAVDGDGNGSFQFSNLSNGIPYFLAVKHRNSIETWSSIGVNFISDQAFYDFSVQISSAFGDNLTQVDNSPLRYAAYGGDVDQEGNVNLNDVILTHNDAINFQTGYVKTDVNGDLLVDLNDIILTNNNSNNFIQKVTP